MPRLAVPLPGLTDEEAAAQSPMASFSALILIASLLTLAFILATRKDD
jgi:hypothetical protein